MLGWVLWSVCGAEEMGGFVEFVVGLVGFVLWNVFAVLCWWMLIFVCVEIEYLRGVVFVER